MNQLVIRSLTFADVRAFLIWEQRVASSNPAAPTNKIKGLAQHRRANPLPFCKTAAMAFDARPSPHCSINRSSVVTIE